MTRGAPPANPPNPPPPIHVALPPNATPEQARAHQQAIMHLLTTGQPMPQASEQPAAAAAAAQQQQQALRVLAAPAPAPATQGRPMAIGIAQPPQLQLQQPPAAPAPSPVLQQPQARASAPLLQLPHTSAAEAVAAVTPGTPAPVAPGNQITQEMIDHHVDQTYDYHQQRLSVLMHMLDVKIDAPYVRRKVRHIGLGYTSSSK